MLSMVGQSIKIAIYFSLSAFFGFAFYVRYWSYRECIQAVKSSCATEGGANLISGGMLWVVPCFIFLVLSIYQSVKFIGRR